MELIKTPSAEHLEVEGRMFEEHPDTGERVFPDGEIYVQLDPDSMDEALLVHSGSPEPNSGMMQLYGALDLLKQREIDTEVFFSYFPYSRQDSEFFEGTLNYAESIMEKLSEWYGVNQIYAVDAHFQQKDWTEDYPFENVQAFRQIEKAVDMDDYRILVPDEGATERFGIEGFSKERITSQKVAVSGDFELEGENVLVLDDMIATGGTMAETYEKVKQLGADRVEAAAVHGILREGLEKVSDKYDRLYLANTVDTGYSSVDIEPLIREKL